MIHIDGQAFSAEIVDGVEGPDLSSVSQSIAHEVRGPHLVRDRRYGRYAQHLQPFSLEASPGLNTEIQLKLPINAVDPLLVPPEPFADSEVGKSHPKDPTPVRLLRLSNQREISPFSPETFGAQRSHVSLIPKHSQAIRMERPCLRTVFSPS